jgi:hypothetical protein
MGFGGQVTLDVAGTPEALYQGLRGDSPTPRVRSVEIFADSTNTGKTIIGPFRDISASDPRYGGYELEKDQVLTIRATDADMVCLEEWYANTENAGNKLRWIVAIGALGEAESIVV